jgi:hypothetical protein
MIDPEYYTAWFDVIDHTKRKYGWPIPTYIEQYMRASGYHISHPSIIHGIGAMKDRIDADSDYFKLIERIEQCVH